MKAQIFGKFFFGDNFFFSSCSHLFTFYLLKKEKINFDDESTYMISSSAKGSLIVALYLLFTYKKNFFKSFYISGLPGFVGGLILVCYMTRYYLEPISSGMYFYKY